MPRPVVPIAPEPLACSRARSSERCDDRISGQAGDTRSRSSTGTPRWRRPSISPSSASRDTTTPLPIRHTTPSRRIPDGIRCSTVFSPPITSVCPALWPPWNRTTACARSASTSTTAPFPSSPHWVPITTTLRPTSTSHEQQNQQTADHHDKPEGAQLAILQPRERSEPAPPGLRRRERKQPLDDQVKREPSEKICPGQASSLQKSRNVRLVRLLRDDAGAEAAQDFAERA